MRKKSQGQSLLEFAIIVPLLVLFILGAAEITLFIGTYINIVDLTREAARYASVKDYKEAPSPSYTPNCSNIDTSKVNGFYYDTACIFSPIKYSTSCSDPNFCNGFNSTVFFKPDQDDILISAFTVSDNVVTAHYPPDVNPGVFAPWAWSNNDADTTHNDNWKRSCDGTNPAEITGPYFSDAKMNDYMETANAGTYTVTAKGFVVVEAYYCYHQVMTVPLVGLLFPNPMKIHVYTIMPLPYADPTSTPMPTDTPAP
jgi:hypothetical protein